MRLYWRPSRTAGCASQNTRAVLGLVFFFLVGIGRDSIFTGLHGTFWAGFSTRGTPQDGAQYSRDSTAYIYIFCAGHSNHATPRDGIQQSRYFTACFARDSATMGHHRTRFNTCTNGTSRDVCAGSMNHATPQSSINVFRRKTKSMVHLSMTKTVFIYLDGCDAARPDLD